MDALLQEIWEAIAPALLEIIAGILALALGWLWNQIRIRIGLEIAEKHRLALHSALVTGAQAALEGRLTGAAARNLALDYVRKSVPDAIRYLSPSPETLSRLIEAKLREIGGGS